MKIELYLDIPDIVLSSKEFKLTLEFNGVEIPTPPANERNEHGHFPWFFDVDPQDKNNIKVIVEGLGDVMDKTKYFNIFESIIDEVNFDIVHLMNCRAQPNGLEYQKGATQLDSDGYLEIPFNLPVWEYWCQTNNAFNYEDYPIWNT